MENPTPDEPDPERPTRALCEELCLLAGALMAERLERACSLLSGPAALLRRESEGGWTPLHRACGAARARREKLIGCISHGAHPKTPDARCECARILLGRAGPLRERMLLSADGFGRSPLHWAALHADVPLCDLLLSAGADPNATDAQGRGALHLACDRRVPLHARSGLPDPTCQVLLAAGADPNAADRRGASAAILAAAGHPDALAALAAAGADFSARNLLGRNPCHIACLANDLDCLVAAAESGADPGEPDAKGRAPFDLSDGRAARAARTLSERLLVGGASEPAKRPGRSGAAPL